MDGHVLQLLGRQAWIGEAVHRWMYGDNDHGPEARKQKPLDLSMIEKLFRACDPDDRVYDEAFHRRLFQEKPQWFGADALPRPKK
jgi:hypothetical protein